MLEVIFFDAVGTLIRLTKSVGENYAFVAQRLGLRLAARDLDRAFAAVWSEMPARPATGQPREEDDKGWWRELVRRVLARVAPAIDPLDCDAFFEAAYAHFAEAGVWELYPDVIDALDALSPHFELAIVSNFDGRLRVICEHLAITKYFRHIFLSSEIGADKPSPEIFRRALAINGVSAAQALHVGDDPEFDCAGAEAAGITFFHLERPQNSLGELVAYLAAARA